MSLVEIDQVYKSYQQGQTSISVLRGISFAVNKADTLAIVGQSGSGKSTLLSLLAGLDHPDQGSISIAHQDLKKLSQDELTQFRGQNIGIIFQQFHLMRSLTALENVMLPLEILKRQNPEKKALEALDLVGLSSRARHLPQQLSGGECQRVAIARAFVVEPSLLLADEPSGSLDTETGERVMQVLFDAVQTRKMTMILVTHDQQLAARCQRKINLVHGQAHA